MYKVLIAEDEMFVRLGIKMSADWGEFDMEVVDDVANGQLAFESYEKNRPDIVMTDIKMPIMDGMSLIRKIREKDSRTRIIILSCLEEFDMVKQAISLGVSDYILKLTMTPEDMASVLAKVKKELIALHESDSSNNTAVPASDYQDILLNYLFYHMYSEEDFKDKMLHIQEKIKEKNLLMAVLEIDNYKEVQERFRDRYGEIIASALENIITELLSEYGEGLVLHAKENRYVLIMSHSNISHKYLVEEHVLAFFSKIRKVLELYLQGKVTFGISEIYNGYENMYEMYQQCLKALEQKFFYSTASNLFWKKVQQQDSRQLFHKMVQELAESLELDEAGYARLMQVSRLFAETMDQHTITSFFGHEISTEVSQMIVDRQKQLQVIERYNKVLSQCPNFNEAAKVYRECLSDMGSYAGNPGTQELVSKSVMDIIRFIKANYQKNITLDQVAGHVGLSRNYTCGLFKKEMGITLSGYMMKYRIDKAKELLMETNLRSYEIAERVGFLDESYFSRSFKKLTGQSPVDYKRKFGKV